MERGIDFMDNKIYRLTRRHQKWLVLSIIAMTVLSFFYTDKTFASYFANEHTGVLSSKIENTNSSWLYPDVSNQEILRNASAGRIQEFVNRRRGNDLYKIYPTIYNVIKSQISPPLCSSSHKLESQQESAALLMRIIRYIHRQDGEKGTSFL
jgi:hypothetical protein